MPCLAVPALMRLLLGCIAMLVASGHFASGPGTFGEDSFITGPNPSCPNGPPGHENFDRLTAPALGPVRLGARFETEPCTPAWRFPSRKYRDIPATRHHPCGR
jgi:hypothetical protein